MEKCEAGLEDTRYTYIIGISGISSSGKTSLARHLRRLFTNFTISASQSGVASDMVGEIAFNVSLLHEDDFFLPESSLPVRRVTIKRQGSKHEETEEAVDMVDWDFPGAINFPIFKKALLLLHQGVPYVQVLQRLGIREAEGPESPEPQPDTAPTGGTVISEEALTEMRRAISSKFYTVGKKVPKSVSKNLQINLILVDGFMLYHRGDDEAEQTGPPLVSLLDLKLLLRVPYDVAKERRESRNGYNTAEGFWVDPEGYFDSIVWPNHVRYHRHIFVEGDVESGTLTEEWGPEGKGIELQSGLGDMEDLLQWASGKVADIVVERIGLST